MAVRRFSGLSRRNLSSRPQRSLLTAIGIVLGVGIVFGVLTLSDTMSESFRNLFSRAFGSADLTVTAAGGSGTFDRSYLEDVRSTPGVEYAAPRLTASSAIILSEGSLTEPPEIQSLRLFGVEPDSADLATGFELAEGRFPERGAELALDANTAGNNGLNLGDTVLTTTPGGTEELEVVGLLEIPGGSFGGVGFGMTPLAYTQAEFDFPAAISGIAVQADDSTGAAELRERLERELGAGFDVEQASARADQVAGQLQGFTIALLFFAGTALFVGGFLVFNALSMTVLERTRELGMLRALGATRAMVARSVILEAVLLGLVGSVLGLALGYGMARGLIYLFGRSFGFTVTELVITPTTLVSALVVGVLITTLAALYPALRAGRVSPVEAMRQAEQNRSGRVVRWGWIPGLVLVAIGAPWTYYLARNLSSQLEGLVYLSGLAGVIGTFLGVSLIIPALVRPFAALFSPVLRALFGIEGKMAALNATRNRGRTALTASALMVGVSLVIAFSALGQSVLGSIESYLDDSLGSDYVIQPAGQDFNVTFSPELERRVSGVTGVESTTSIASTVRRQEGEPTFVFGLDRSFPEIFQLTYSSGPEDAFERLDDGRNALVGRQLSESRNLGPGDRIELPGPGSVQSYEVVGVLESDFLGGGASVYISKANIERDFNVNAAGFLAVKAEPGSDREAVGDALEEVLAGYPQLALYSNAEWKERIESDFARQYVFFYAIMGVAVAVSAFGVINTLSMSVFERTREIGILRAVGTTRLQIGRLIIDEGVVISSIGCVLGIAVGSILGYLFVRGSGAGGFEVEFYYPTAATLGALLGGFAIGVLAGLLPARSAAKTNIVEAVQYE
jgi:putative ABC transport system permease protein